jgi:drug/metabolite transporter (DMT)-like permease
MEWEVPGRETPPLAVSVATDSSFVQSSSRRAVLMLLLVTLFWGLSFPLGKNWLLAARDRQCPGGEPVAVLTMIGVRMLLALLILAVFKPALFRKPGRREFGIGLVVGFANFLGFTLQVWGLTETTPALSAFITSLASAWVPLVALVFFQLPVSLLTLAGLGVAVGGAAVLCGIDTQSGWTLGWGEKLTLFASLIFAVMIVLLDRLGRNARPGHLTIGFLTATGLPALLLAGFWPARESGTIDWLHWTISMLREPLVFRDVFLLTVFCTVLGFHWMTTYQPRVPASRAALIYLFEPVFASVFSILWQHDQVTPRLLVGGGLILGGNLLVELPLWLRARAIQRTVTES